MKEGRLLHVMLIGMIIMVLSIWGHELYVLQNTPYDNTMWEQKIEQIKNDGDLFVGYYSALSERH